MRRSPFAATGGDRGERDAAMPMDAREKELIIDLIGSVRRLAAQMLTVHLQLGAVRTILGRQGTLSETEFESTFEQLQAVSEADAVVSGNSVNELFDELLERLQDVD